MFANGPKPGRLIVVKIYTKTGDDGMTGLLGTDAYPRTISASRLMEPSMS